ncbi:MAG: cyclic nucleotide-binding domain-containing protein [Bacteroidota bacterium]
MDSLWDNIFRSRDETGPAALLRQVPMFADLDRREIAEVRKILYRREYRAGEVIFRQDDPGVGMYVIEEGTVDIVHEPTNRVLADLGVGDVFGEIALLNETPRSARAVATTATTLYGLFQPELYDLVKRAPRLGVKLLLPLARTLGARLVHADEQLERLHAQAAAAEESVQSNGARDVTVG